MAIQYSDLGMSVKMRLYSMSKRNVVVAFLSFLGLYFISLNFGIFGPQMLNSISTSAVHQSKSTNLQTGPFTLVTPYLNKFHQKLWITVKPLISGRKEEFSKEFYLGVNLRENPSDKSGLKPINSGQYFNHTRSFHCKNEVCDLFTILHLDYIHIDQYLIEFRMHGLSDTAGLKIDDYMFTFNSYNPSFTKLELWFRFLFLFINFVIIIIYTRSLKKFSLRDWSIEQKWMFILLRSLLFFNNPLFPMCVLFDSWLPHVLDALFQSSFFSLVLVFWLSFFHGVRQNDRNFLTFYVPKFGIVFLMWLLSSILLLWQQWTSLDDPSYTLTTDESSYIVFRVFFIVISIVYLLFLLFLIVRAVAELRNTPYYDVRIKFSMALMLVVITTLVTIGITRYRAEPFRQSLFENFTKNYHSSIEFCAIFSIFNIYIYTLAFVYSPAKNAAIENDYRDNPTFAMLNTESDKDDDDDADEDVIYGN